jgi:predicted metal-dependent hydrolase
MTFMMTLDLDYTIIHELCHTKVKEHFHGFWKFLQQFEPEYVKKSKWLEINSKNILC